MEAEEVMIVTARLLERWRDSGCKVSAGAAVAVIVSSSSIAVL